MRSARCPLHREIVALFYIGTYSQNDISAFLGVPVSTVKMRLFHARKTLHAELVSEIETGLPERRPSRNSRFLEKTVSYEIQTKTVPAQQIISMVRDSFISELQAHLDGGIKTLTVYAQASGIRTIGLPMAIYHGAVREDRHAPVEVCLPVTGAIQSTIEIAVKELPAATIAYTTTAYGSQSTPAYSRPTTRSVSGSQPAVMRWRMTRARSTSTSTRPSSARRQALTTRASK